jgi:mannose-6-phosphate isomerase-like protein (cupin superfamily)
MARQLIPVTLAGGQGTRLWPLSRAARPKQFLPLMGEASLFQRTLERVRDPALYAPPVIVTNSEYRFIVAEQAAEVDIGPASTISTLQENQSIYLPQGCVHRLANPGKIDLELIEVQTGSYLGEDDILRLEDDFGRPCSPA